VVETDTCDTCADGLATRTPDAANVHAIRELVDDVVLVSEEQMLDAIRHLYQKEGIVAEPAGAAATAAFLASPRRDPSTVLLVSGATSQRMSAARRNPLKPLASVGPSTPGHHKSQ